MVSNLCVTLMTTEYELRNEIVEIGRWLYEREYVVAMEGNISARLDGEILVTPTAACKGLLTADQIVKTDPKGRKLEGEYKPSTEFAMHLEVYRQRPDVKAVVHAHPPYASAFAVAGIPLDKALIAEIVALLGCIPLAKYGAPSTEELPASIRELVPYYDAILLANHGAVAYGTSLKDAYFKMETVEHFAKINLLLRILGRESPLPRQEVDKLFELRQKYGIRAADVRSLGCPVVEEGEETITLSKTELVNLLEGLVTRLGLGKD